MGTILVLLERVSACHSTTVVPLCCLCAHCPQIEAAYDVLFMQSMKKRISGELEVSSSVRYADVPTRKRSGSVSNLHPCAQAPCCRQPWGWAAGAFVVRQMFGPDLKQSSFQAAGYRQLCVICPRGLSPTAVLPRLSAAAAFLRCSAHPAAEAARRCLSGGAQAEHSSWAGSSVCGARHLGNTAGERHPDMSMCAAAAVVGLFLTTSP